MEILWHILLTVCLGSTCINQDVQWFESKEECYEMLSVYVEMPVDGHWDVVEYICKPVGSTGT
jgi:hypothetical protein